MMTNHFKTQLFFAVAALAFIVLEGGLWAAELPSITGINLANVGLGMNESDFTMLYPDARKAGVSPSVQQYWIMQGALHMLEFRQEKLALIMVSHANLNEDDQRKQTIDLVQQYIKRFGPPGVSKSAKLLRRGVAEIRALVYDLKAYRPRTKAIVESSELELAITIYDESLRGNERLFFSTNELLDELNTNATQPKEILKAGTYFDYVAEYIVQHAYSPSAVRQTSEASTNNVGQANGGTNFQAKAQKTDNAKTESSPGEKATSSTAWSFIGVLIVAGCGLLLLVFKRRL